MNLVTMPRKGNMGEPYPGPLPRRADTGDLLSGAQSTFSCSEGTGWSTVVYHSQLFANR